MSVRPRRILAIAIVGAVGAALLRVLGLEPLFACAWGVLVVGVLIAVFTVHLEDAPPWPPEAPKPRAGLSEIAQLSWALSTSDGNAGTPAVRRVREIARRRLARAGIDLDDPDQQDRIAVLLGADVAATLRAPHPRLAAVQRVLDVLETSAASHPPTTEEPPR